MITHPDRVHIEHPLPNPAAFCVASDEVLVCADDEQRAIIQVTSEKDGVPTRGKSHLGLGFFLLKKKKKKKKIVSSL